MWELGGGGGETSNIVLMGVLLDVKRFLFRINIDHLPTSQGGILFFHEFPRAVCFCLSYSLHVSLRPSLHRRQFDMSYMYVIIKVFIYTFQTDVETYKEGDIY